MRRQIDLGGRWQVTHSEGLHGAVEQVRAEEVDEGRYLAVPVPGEIHEALEGLGLLPDLNQGLHTLAARWVEEQWWLYRRTVELEAADCARPAWLVFAELDFQAIVYLNGEEIGRHANAHRPCRLEVTGRLRPGRNLLAIAVESGLYYVADRPGADYTPELFTPLTKRHWLRKAQYEAGWDWHPRLLNVGISGPVHLELSDEPWLETVTVLTTLAADHTRATLQVRAFVSNPRAVERCRLRVRVRETGVEAAVSVAPAAGITRTVAAVEIADPALWWPRGHGPQPLYTLEVTLEQDDAVLDHQTQRTGIREVRLAQEPHPVAGRYCIVEVNGRSIFCKGGNWVPPDLIPSRVTPGRLRDLVDLAVGAEFNILRIWGGGVYAGHDLLDLCDEAGLLVWHDLPFACTRYPGDDPAFLAEVRAEVAWAVRAFAAHPSLVVWCGNNEQEWGAWDWGFDRTGKALPDYALYHHVIPVIVREEDGTRPYWPSSPYSPDHQDPNSPLIGDQHPWSVGQSQDHGADFWAYRDFVDRLPNEGGFLGASPPATLRRFLPEGERYVRSPSWEHHDNAANYRTSSTGITYQAVHDWLGRDPCEMPLDEYVLASGLLQAEALTEYIANYRRRMFSSASAIFWMYNDSWPVTHGWSIVDYYLRRKLAYHPVRRANAPVTVVVAADGERVTVFGINDTPHEWTGEARHGLFTLAGTYLRDERHAVRLPANASTPLGAVDRAAWAEAGTAHAGAFAVLYRDDAPDTPVAQHRLFLSRFKDLSFHEPALSVSRQGDRVVVRANAFVWGVCLDRAGDGDAPDNAFDLVPGIPYVLPWPTGLDDPRIAAIGSRDLLRQPRRGMSMRG